MWYCDRRIEAGIATGGWKQTGGARGKARNSGVLRARTRLRQTLAGYRRPRQHRNRATRAIGTLNKLHTKAKLVTFRRENLSTSDGVDRLI
jgi:hypothetical protein